MESPAQLRDLTAEVQQAISQYEEEFDAAKKARRPGRPATAREDLLKRKVAGLREEYKNGFGAPTHLLSWCHVCVLKLTHHLLDSHANVTKQETAKTLDQWDGTWTTLTTIPWVKISQAGQARSSEFPSRGLN